MHHPVPGLLKFGLVPLGQTMGNPFKFGSHERMDNRPKENQGHSQIEGILLDAEHKLVPHPRNTCRLFLLFINAQRYGEMAELGFHPFVLSMVRGRHRMRTGSGCILRSYCDHAGKHHNQQA